MQRDEAYLLDMLLSARDAKSDAMPPNSLIGRYNRDGLG